MASEQEPGAKPGLVRALGPLMATAIVVGTVIGSGIFKKPQAVAENVPHFGWVAVVWILGGVLAFLGALALTEVAVLFPRAGGNYVFLREGYGRLAGFLWGWVEFWIIRSASLAALATIFTESLHDILKATAGSRDAVLSFWEQRLATVSVLVGLAVINVRGVRWGGGLQFFITSIKVASLLAIMLLPLIIVALGRSPSQRVPTEAVSVFTLTPGASAGHRFSRRPAARGALSGAARDRAAGPDHGTLADGVAWRLVGLSRLDEHRSGRRGGSPPAAEHPHRLDRRREHRHLPLPGGEPRVSPGAAALGNDVHARHAGGDGV